MNAAVAVLQVVVVVESLLLIGGYAMLVQVIRAEKIAEQRYSSRWRHLLAIERVRSRQLNERARRARDFLNAT